MNILKEISYLLLCIILLGSCSNSSTTDAEYSGKNISNDFEILRDKNSKAASIVVKKDQNWKLYAGRQIDSIDFSKPIAKGKDAGTFPIYDITNSSKYYFQVVTSEGKAIISERQLPIAKAFNYRDLGGYINREGYHIKWGKLFRADDLRGLSDMDIRYLESIPLTCVFDFRLEEEQLAPDKLPITIQSYYRYPISFGNARAMITEGMTKQTKDEYVAKLMNIYKMLVLDSTSISQYQQLFENLENQANSPAVFYCSVGKDRIGVVTALVLAALNVDEQVIMQDYLLTNAFIDERYKSLTDRYPDLKVLLQVNESYLNHAFALIKFEYGSMEKYLKNVLHVDMEKMKELYLTK